MRSLVSATEQIRDGIVVTLLFAAIMGLWSDCAAAQEALPPLPDIRGLCAPEVTGNRRTTLVHEGVTGFWFHGDVARCMLSRLDAGPRYVDRVHLLEQRLLVGEEREELLRRQAALAEQGEARAVATVEAADRRARDAVERMNAWFRAPELWFAVGGIVGIGLVILGAWALGQVGLSLAL